MKAITRWLRETGKAMSWSILLEHALVSGEKFFLIDFFRRPSDIFSRGGRRGPGGSDVVSLVIAITGVSICRLLHAPWITAEVVSPGIVPDFISMPITIIANGYCVLGRAIRKCEERCNLLLKACSKCGTKAPENSVFRYMHMYRATWRCERLTHSDS